MTNSSCRLSYIYHNKQHTVKVVHRKELIDRVIGVSWCYWTAIAVIRVLVQLLHI